MKMIVAHPAQQHSYRLAAALKKAGFLDKYMTTVYYKKHSLTALAALFLRGTFHAKAKGRRCPDLSDDDVVQFCEMEGLLKLLALNTGLLKPWYRKIKYHTADRFAVRAANEAIRAKADAVITYDDTSPLLFEILEKKAPKVVRILDMSAANTLYMRRIYEADLLRMPAFGERLRKERAVCWDPVTEERTGRELAAAEYFMVPSDFVARSLIYSGISRDRIFLCPYGVDTETFSLKSYDDLKSGSRPIEFVYVGGVKELKGIAYLLEAFMSISEEEAHLTVIGHYDPADQDTMPYAGRVRFTGTLLHSEIPKALKAGDVFVMPSLGEGMSLSVIEAAACGLPVIATQNSGVESLITDGENGFIIPIQSVDALRDKILYFVQHPDRIRDMGMKAGEAAQSCSWDKYTENVTRVIGEIMAADVKKRERGRKR